MNDFMNAPAIEFKDTAVGPIPLDWDVVRFGELLELRRENLDPAGALHLPYVGLEHMDSGTLALRRMGDAYEVRSAKSRFYPGDVLYGKLRPYLDKAVLVTMEGMCSTDVLVFRAKDSMNAGYLVALLHTRHFINHAVATTSGVNHPRTSWQALRELVVPLPPLPEQRAIARALRTVQQTMEATERVIAGARELKRSLMDYLFTYGPVPVDQAESVPLKDTEIGPVSEAWEVVRLDEVVVSAQYGLSVRAGDKGAYPMLRMNNLSEGKIDVSDVKYVDLCSTDFEKFKLSQGDVLFNRTNSLDLVGKTALFDSAADFVFASYLIRVITDTTKVLPRYLSYYLNWNEAAVRLKTLATRGISQSNISATKLRQFAIGFPSPGEQQRSIAVLLAADQKIALEEQRKAALQVLFKSMLEQLMTGQVRVTLT